MIAPDRIAQIQIARIGSRADHSAAHRTGGGTQSRITGSRANRGAARGTKQCTTCSAITRIGAATGEHQSRRKTNYHCRAHI